MIPEYRKQERINYEDLPEEILSLSLMFYDMIEGCGDPTPTLEEFDYLMHRGSTKFLMDKMGIDVTDPVTG